MVTHRHGLGDHDLDPPAPASRGRAATVTGRGPRARLRVHAGPARGTAGHRDAAQASAEDGVTGSAARAESPSVSGRS